MQDFQVKIYETLVAQKVPEAIAEFLASRCDRFSSDMQGADAADICLYGFNWDFQPEEKEFKFQKFWSSFHDALEAELAFPRFYED